STENGPSQTQAPLAPQQTRNTSGVHGAPDGRAGGGPRPLAAVAGGTGEGRGLGSLRVLGPSDWGSGRGCPAIARTGCRETVPGLLGVRGGPQEAPSRQPAVLLVISRGVDPRAYFHQGLARRLDERCRVLCCTRSRLTPQSCLLGLLRAPVAPHKA